MTCSCRSLVTVLKELSGKQRWRFDTGVLELSQPVPGPWLIFFSPCLVPAAPWEQSFSHPEPACQREDYFQPSSYSNKDVKSLSLPPVCPAHPRGVSLCSSPEGGEQRGGACSQLGAPLFLLSTGFPPPPFKALIWSGWGSRGRGSSVSAPLERASLN